MAGWEAVIQNDDYVSTPHGAGKVRRISNINGTAQVDVGGQLFEVPLGQVTKQDKPQGGTETPVTPQPTPAKALMPWDARRGKRVQTKDGAMKGEITEVTQRSVKVKFDNGINQNFEKRRVGSQLDHEGGTPRPQQPEQKPEAPEQKQEAEAQQPETQKPETQAKDTVTQTGDGLHEIFKLKEYMEKKVEAEVDDELKELRELAKRNQKLEVKIGDKVNVVEGLKHKQLEQLITYCALRLNPLLVGMAGTGKTHAAEQTAEALGLPFYSMSVGAQTSKSDIIGYMDASGNYVRTHFREAYENGGIFLMDEVDAGNANVLIQVNAALSNGLCAFPDAMVKRHPDFVFIASANTFGNGANRQYVGRNQLDAATLDRFAIIEWLIDDELESNLATGLNGKAWYMAVRAARDYITEKSIRALASPRATQKGSKLLDVGIGIEEVIKATLLGSVPDDKKADVTQVVTTIFNKFASEVPKQLPVEVDPPTAADLVRTADNPF
jgi:cobaltochelatase CobS